MAVPIEIDVWQGEIAELEVDAIIVPANESLFMTHPLAQSVKRRAGETVEREAVAQSPVPPGAAAVTGFGIIVAFFCSRRTCSPNLNRHCRFLGSISIDVVREISSATWRRKMIARITTRTTVASGHENLSRIVFTQSTLNLAFVDLCPGPAPKQQVHLFFPPN